MIKRYLKEYINDRRNTYVRRDLKHVLANFDLFARYTVVAVERGYITNIEAIGMLVQADTWNLGHLDIHQYFSFTLHESEVV